MRPTPKSTLARLGLEALLTLLAVVWLVWLGAGFGGADWRRGGDDRYQRDRELQVDLPAEARRAGWTAEFCGRFGDWLPAEDGAVCRDFRRPGLAATLAAKLHGRSAEESPPPTKPVTDDLHRRVREALPPLAEAHAALLRALAVPLAAAEKARAERERHAAEGFVEEGWEEEFRKPDEETRVYREAYHMVRTESGRAFPQPLECAWSFLSRRLETPTSAADTGAVEALAGLAALLDGRGERLPAGSFRAGATWDARETRLGCEGAPEDAARQGAALVRLARASSSNAAKAAAVGELLPWARWQLAAWALAGGLVLTLGRRGGQPRRRLCLALALWAGIAALTQPHLEWVGGGEAGWLAGGWQAPLALALAAILVPRLPLKRPLPPATPASGLGYPGFVLFAGLGWWLLLDLSANGHFDNRFQGLYQQGNLFLAFLALSLLPILRGALAVGSLRALSFWPLAAAGGDRRAAVFWGLGMVAAGAGVALVWLFLRDHRQLTSELFRGALLLGLAWVLLARADILASPWLALPPWGWRRSDMGAWRRALFRRLKLAAPLLPLLLLVLGGLLATKDRGPLLVILYFAALFVGVGMALRLSGRIGLPLGIAAGMVTLAAYVWGLSIAIMRLGGRLGGLIGERVQSAEQPFLASNDQMAHVLWFQEAAAEAGGFGFDAVPWCGEITGACRGVPPQIQSDYIFTALLGVFGPWAWALLGLFGLWLWRVARAHPAATSGRVDTDDPGQAWLSWLALCWVGLNLTQTAITVAGNLCWLPLTGITFPFVSYGTWSLLANATLLGLSLNLNRRAP
jgi:cell division protein FtsW (lipid II flippase)